MSTHFNDIQAALDTKLATLTGTPVAFPNIPYEPKAGTAYIRANFLPSETQQASMGDNGKDLTTGLYRLSLFVPKGSGRPSQLDTLGDLFKRGTTLTYNGVNVRVRAVSIGSPLETDSAWYSIPVTVNFYTYTEARS
jgi:hypothetical protein